jgi:hypothetical protein
MDARVGHCCFAVVGVTLSGPARRDDSMDARVGHCCFQCFAGVGARRHIAVSRASASHGAGPLIHASGRPARVRRSPRRVRRAEPAVSRSKRRRMVSACCPADSTRPEPGSGRPAADKTRGNARVAERGHDPLARGFLAAVYLYLYLYLCMYVCMYVCMYLYKNRRWREGEHLI